MDNKLRYGGIEKHADATLVKRRVPWRTKLNLDPKLNEVDLEEKKVMDNLYKAFENQALSIRPKMKVFMTRKEHGFWNNILIDQQSEYATTQ